MLHTYIHKEISYKVGVRSFVSGVRKTAQNMLGHKVGVRKTAQNMFGHEVGVRKKTENML